MRTAKAASAVRLDLRLPPELMEALRTAAWEHRRSLNAEVIHALTKHLESTEPEEQE